MASYISKDWYCHIARRYVSARDLRLCSAINKMLKEL